MAESSGNSQNPEAEAEQGIKMSTDMDGLLQNQNNILSKLQRPSRRQLRRRGGLATATRGDGDKAGRGLLFCVRLSILRR